VDFSQKKIIVIVGPTAVGKTSIALQLAKYFQTEIISADSRQVFKELTIGTAKPTPEELQQVRHYFINSHSITQRFDAVRFGEEAEELIYKLFRVHDHVIVCGGSGLYVKALLEGFDEVPDIPDEVREKIVQQYQQNGITWLQNELKELDPRYYYQLDAQNPQRLMRALEVVVYTGTSLGDFHGKNKKKFPFQVIKIGLELERGILYRRIDDRMDEMVAAGLFEEAASLLAYRHHNALQTVGYQEIFDFMDGAYNREEAIRLLKRNSRRYAKRQLTWFKRDPQIMWMNPANIGEIIKMI
jgi:tRNA dimethylallyltransferase